MIPLDFGHGVSAIQATQLYTGALMWLMILLIIGVGLVILVLGDVIARLDAIHKALVEEN